MKIKNLAVIVTSYEDKAYQVALTDEKIESLISDLRNLYFSDGVIKIIDNELSGLEIVTRKELNKEEEQKSDSIMSDIISESEANGVCQHVYRDWRCDEEFQVCDKCKVVKFN